MLSVAKPGVIMLSVILLTVIILKVVVSSVEMPEKVNFFYQNFHFLTERFQTQSKPKRSFFGQNFPIFSPNFSIFLAVKFSFDKMPINLLIFVALGLVYTMAKVALS
jgi:hypothetical protein